MSGWCFDDSAAVDRVDLLVDGGPQPVVASRMPRHQVWLEAGGRQPNAYRSGFWGFVELRDKPEWRVGVRCWIAGEPYDHLLGTVRAGDRRPATSIAPAASDAREVVICMTTYNPDPAALRTQVDSIRAQTHPAWRCIVSDDHSRDELYQMVRRTVGEDARFELHRNPERLGFYGNFEACLAHVPAGAAYVALADQDDRWYPQKLQRLVDALEISGAVLAYSDMRIVNRDGAVIRETFWDGTRRNNCTDMGMLLLANSVTGAASLMDRRLLDVALPFPLIRGQYHDHWLACVALAVGDIAYVDEPLHDYIQHGRNVLGHRAQPGPDNSSSRMVQQWYFVNVVGSMMFARELQLRLGTALDGRRAPVAAVADLDSRSGSASIVRRALQHPRDARTIQVLAGLGWRILMRHLPGGPWRRLSVTRSAYPDPVARSA